jgi:hypothetical protein
MKTYRIYLKNGVSFTVKAIKIKVSTLNKTLEIYKEEGGNPDPEFYVAPGELAAIVPESAAVEMESK